MKQRLKKEEVKLEMHQHTKRDGIPFGKSHPIDALHRNIITCCCHNITLLTEVIRAEVKGYATVNVADLKSKKYMQKLI